MELVAIQLVSSPDIDNNFAQVEMQLEQWARQRQSPCALVVLPECFALFGGGPGLNLQHQEPIGDGPIQRRMAALARQYSIWLVGGTIPTCSQRPNKFYASAIVFDPDGQLVTHYQKLHLFDADVTDNTGAYRESDTTVPGGSVIVFMVEGITVGLAVCYDVRFPALFQQLAEQGAQVIAIPSAFTQPTGEAHWHTLMRARAIENQVYIVASGQGGTHANGRQTYGHSLIVDPWGSVVSEIDQDDQGSGWVVQSIDFQLLAQIRRNMPLGQHNRFKNELTHEFSRN